MLDNREKRNSMEKLLLEAFKLYLERQDILNKLTEIQSLSEYGYSEIHTIAAINELKNPNVTSIANHLRMSRSAISKIAKKLINKNLISTYELDNNKQKIFFKLTTSGKVLYAEHSRRHCSWEKRDLDFFKQFSPEEIKSITTFMNFYNEYLDLQINILEENNHE